MNFALCPMNSPYIFLLFYTPTSNKACEICRREQYLVASARISKRLLSYRVNIESGKTLLMALFPFIPF